MSGLIELKCDRGQELLDDVRNRKGLFQPLLFSLFKKQIGNKNCGVQSVAMLLGAHDLGCRQGTSDGFETKYNEMSLLDMPETCTVVTPQKIVECNGMGLKDVVDLLAAHGHDKTSYHHAADGTVDEFRQSAKDALKESNSSAGIIVNYHMATLGQSLPFGHHSPLAGYHEESDRFLLLDVWETTEECWALAEDLFKAMYTVDSATGKTRGYILLK